MNAMGINQGTSGNISARYGDNMLITPSGMPYEEMDAKDIVPMTLTGDYGSYAGENVPSSEWRFHLDIMLARPEIGRSEEHTSELQSLMRISYAVFCLKKKKTNTRDKYKDDTT